MSITRYGPFRTWRKFQPEGWKLVGFSVLAVEGLANCRIFHVVRMLLGVLLVVEGLTYGRIGIRNIVFLVIFAVEGLANGGIRVMGRV